MSGSAAVRLPVLLGADRADVAVCTLVKWCCAGDAPRETKLFAAGPADPAYPRCMCESAVIMTTPRQDRSLLESYRQPLRMTLTCRPAAAQLRGAGVSESLHRRDRISLRAAVLDLCGEPKRGLRQSNHGIGQARGSYGNWPIHVPLPALYDAGT